MIYETHCHTPLCKHAVGQPVEYAEAAERQGLRGIIFTCHNPMPDGFSSGVRMAEEELDEYIRIVQDARQRWLGRVDVRLGIEADYFAGYEPWLERQLSSAEFHYVLGSVHPQVREYRARYYHDDPLHYQRIYFDLLAEAAETGLFDCLSHPDLIKNEMPQDWQPERIMQDICAALDRIAATGMAMELNTSGLNKAIPEMNPFPEMLRAMCQRKIPVVIGADAHSPQRVGERFEQAADLLRACGYREVSYFLNRQRHSVPL